MVEKDQLKQLVLALAGQEDVGCVGESDDKAVDLGVRKDDERDARERSPHPLRLIQQT